MFNLTPLFLILLLLISASQLTACVEEKTELRGAGATFPAPIYARWRALFHRENPNIVVHYDAVGSGSGIQLITDKKVDFGASDALLTRNEQRALDTPLLTIPTVIGPVVLAYNLPMIEQKIRLSGEVIVGIYKGDIKRWNDPKLQLINPEINLPDIEIHVAYRADSSGTSHIFTSYLSAIDEDWQENIGTGKKVNWPTSDEWAGEGNDGVAHRILLEPGGIGYLELKYAQNAGLNYADLINQEGMTVSPTVESVQQAELNTPAPQKGYLKTSIVNAPGKGSYPIAGFTYLLVYKDLSDMPEQKRQALFSFLDWILGKGQQEVSKLHYTPLPEALKTRVRDDITKIKVNLEKAEITE
jgi:phosphate transport system substrate-binding protein